MQLDSGFSDDRGRLWSFRFLPRDMPRSDRFIHAKVSDNIGGYKDQFGDQVCVAKDVVLVMGKDEGELRRLSEDATLATERMPWTLEVDFWRSFVNVDLQFVEGLDSRWLE